VHLHCYCFFSTRISFTHGITSWRVLPIFPTHDAMQSTIQYTSLQTRYRSIINAKLEAVNFPSVNRAHDASGVEIKSNWHTGRITTNADDYYPDCRTPPSQRQKSHTIDPDVFKTTSITSNGYNQPPDNWEFMIASLNASIHGGNLEITEPNWPTRSVTDIEGDDHEYRTRSIERDHQPKRLQRREWAHLGMP